MLDHLNHFDHKMPSGLTCSLANRSCHLAEIYIEMIQQFLTCITIQSLICTHTYSVQQSNNKGQTPNNYYIVI